MSQSLMPFIWVTITLPALLLLQRWIHRHLHGIALMLTGNRSWAVILYAIVLFPGVLLHEISHWITATILGVRTGSFSILPRAQEDGSIQLGYVEYYRSSSVGPIRESLIGSAPLITGTVCVLLIGLKIFDFSQVASAIQVGDVEILTQAMTNLLTTGDAFVWIYLLFAVSNAMMPSPSDRRAWPAFALSMLTAAVVLYVLGLQELMIMGITGPIAAVFGHLGTAFSLSIGVDLLVILLIYSVEWLIGRIKGVELIYGPGAQSSQK
jgi:hypothetical protein